MVTTAVNIESTEALLLMINDSEFGEYTQPLTEQNEI